MRRIIIRFEVIVKLYRFKVHNIMQARVDFSEIIRIYLNGDYNCGDIMKVDQLRDRISAESEEFPSSVFFEQLFDGTLPTSVH